LPIAGNICSLDKIAQIIGQIRENLYRNSKNQSQKESEDIESAFVHCQTTTQYHSGSGKKKCSWSECLYQAFAVGHACNLKGFKDFYWYKVFNLCPFQ
jgi:hypothetical protein